MGFEYVKILSPIHKGPLMPLVGIMAHLVMSDILIYPFNLKELTHTYRDPRSYQKGTPFIYLLFIQPYILWLPNFKGQIKDVKMEV